MMKTELSRFCKLAVLAGLASFWAFTGEELKAQSSEAAASERVRWLKRNIGGPDEVIDQNDVIAFLEKEKGKGNSGLVAAVNESKCGQPGELDCATWIRVVVRQSFGNADQNPHNQQIDTDELKVFETTKISETVLFGDLINEAPPPASGSDAPQQRSTLPRWLGTVVTIRRSFLDERGASDPASIAWLHFGGGDETLNANQRRTRFDIQAAISIELAKKPWRLGSNWDLTPVLVVEGDVSTDETLEHNSVIHRLGAEIYGQRDIDRKWTAHFIDLTFDYKTDRDYRSEVLGGTLQYTPNIPKLGVGAYTSSTGPLFFRWRPFVGLTYSDVRDPGQIASLQKSDGFTNAFARLRFEVTIGNAQRVTAAAEGQYLRELEEEDKGHTAYGGSLRFVLDREGHTFLVLSYDQGEKPPSFKSKEQTKIALGIKF